MTRGSTRLLLAAGALALLTLAAVVSGLVGNDGRQAVGPDMHPPASEAREGAPRSPAFASAEGRDALAPAAPRPVAEDVADDEPATPSRLTALELRRRAAREDAATFDATAAELVADAARPLSERADTARAAWLERSPVAEDCYRAALSADDPDAASLSRAVERWLAEDAPRDPRARDFTARSLWGPDRLTLSPVVRGRLVAGLAAAADDARWRDLETRLRAEADDDVVRSALIARGRVLDRAEATLLFQRFGIEPPPDLHVREGD